MKNSLKQQKPLTFNSPFIEQAHHPQGVKSFDKVILKELPNVDCTIYQDKKKHAKYNVKLFRFKKAPANQYQLLFFIRSPQSMKSLKSVRDIALTDPQIKFRYLNKGVNHLRMLVAKYTKCSTIRLNLIADGNIDCPEARFLPLWTEIFKELRRCNPLNLKILIKGFWNGYYRTKNEEGLSWWRYTFQLLKFMKNLRFLHLDTHLVYKSKFEDDQSKVCEYTRQMKRLCKLKEIVLGGVELITSANNSAAIYQYLSAPPAIEQVAIKVNKSEASQPIAESLKKIKNLKCFAFQGNLEIPDLVSVIQTHPGLNNVNAIGFWSPDNENIPIDTLTQGLQLHNITHLNLYVYLPINSKQDCSFYRKLMETFVNLESLRIGFDTVKKMDFAGEYADILTPLKKITRLELALSFTLENMIKFFTQMQPLATLKHFIFVANIQVPRTVAKQFPQAVEPLKKLLLGLHKLESFEMYFAKLGLVFLQGICQVMLSLKKLKSITFTFETSSDKYIPVHDNMIAEIQNTVEAITCTQEFYVTMISGESWDIKLPKELVECQNTNLKKFKFTIGSKYDIPVYGKRWF